MVGVSVKTSQIRNEILEVVMNSLVIGRRYGHITEEQFNEMKKEAQEMFRDSDEQILALGKELVKVRENHGHRD